MVARHVQAGVACTVAAKLTDAPSPDIAIDGVLVETVAKSLNPEAKSEHVLSILVANGIKLSPQPPRAPLPPPSGALVSVYQRTKERGRRCWGIFVLTVKHWFVPSEKLVWRAMSPTKSKGRTHIGRVVNVTFETESPIRENA